MSMRSHLCLSVFSELLESYCSSITNCVTIFSTSPDLTSLLTLLHCCQWQYPLYFHFWLPWYQILLIAISFIASPHVAHDSFAATQLWSCLWSSDLIWPMELCVFQAGAPEKSRWYLLPRAASWTKDDLQLSPQLTGGGHGTWLKVSFLA